LEGARKDAQAHKRALREHWERIILQYYENVRFIGHSELQTAQQMHALRRYDVILTLYYADWIFTCGAVPDIHKLDIQFYSYGKQ
jgi:hypothetical protein